MTTIIKSKGGTYSGFPLAIRSPAQESALKYYGLYGGDATKSAKNLKLGASFQGALVGSPTINTADILVGNGKYIDTGLQESASMTIITAFKGTRPDGTTATTAPLLSEGNFGTNDLQCYIAQPFPTTITGLAVNTVIGYDNGSGGLTNKTMALQGIPENTPYMIAIVIEDGVGRRTYDLTGAIAAVITADTTARRPHISATLRTGSDIGATGRNGTFNIYAQALFNAALSKADIDLVAAAMRTRLAARGVTV